MVIVCVCVCIEYNSISKKICWCLKGTSAAPLPCRFCKCSQQGVSVPRHRCPATMNICGPFSGQQHFAIPWGQTIQEGHPPPYSSVTEMQCATACPDISNNAKNINVKLMGKIIPSCHVVCLLPSKKRKMFTYREHQANFNPFCQPKDGNSISRDSQRAAARPLSISPSPSPSPLCFSTHTHVHVMRHIYNCSFISVYAQLGPNYQNNYVDECGCDNRNCANRTQ